MINLLVLSFSRCAEFLLATKIGGAMAIHKKMGEKNGGSWGPVATSIRLAFAVWSGKREILFTEILCLQLQFLFF